MAAKQDFIDDYKDGWFSAEIKSKFHVTDQAIMDLGKDIQKLKLENIELKHKLNELTALESRLDKLEGDVYGG